jgi:hypothetical protein
MSEYTQTQTSNRKYPSNKRPEENRPQTTTSKRHTSQQDRERRIAEAAYYLAERRNFQGGDPVQDWLTAEKQIDERY